jgi:surfeit locus 1 family protein
MMDEHGRETAGSPAPRRPRKVVRLALAVLGSLLIVLFAGLGTWQVQRLSWKLALIERVNARVAAPPQAAPSVARWSEVTRANDEYRRVSLAGYFLHDYSTPVQAVSELGAGYWLLTPLCTQDGSIVLVNRGFIAASENRPGRYPARRAPAQACQPGPGARHAVLGLLRLPEPGGGFLRQNDPVNNRWFSRDVAGIAAARGLDQVAPYFVDAARGQEQAGAPERPVGGLTVISFQNNHLVYALTWFALALMVAAALWYGARSPAGKGAGRAENGGPQHVR